MNKYADHSQVQERRLEKICRFKKSFPDEASAYQKGQKTYRCKICKQWHRSSSVAVKAKGKQELVDAVARIQAECDRKLKKERELRLAAEKERDDLQAECDELQVLVDKFRPPVTRRRVVPYKLLSE